MKRTYATLDGIRGIAALLIVVRHTSAFFGGFQPQETFLAVDLFFGLSGFVLGHSYEARLNDGLSPGGFMTIRLNRFVPLYVLGLALGAVAATVAILSGGADLDWTSVGVSFALGLFFLPSPMFGATGAKLFPLNDPSWSLFMELFANAAMAVFWRRLSNRVLVGICATSAALLAISALKLGTADLGFRWVGLGFGVYRVGYSFFAGLLVYRLRDRIGLAIHPVVAFLLVAFALVRSVGDAGRAIYELAWIFVGFPLLIAAASAREPVIGARIVLLSRRHILRRLRPALSPAAPSHVRHALGDWPRCVRLRAVGRICVCCGSVGALLGARSLLRHSPAAAAERLGRGAATGASRAAAARAGDLDRDGARRNRLTAESRSKFKL